jgi:hypothetical protein
MEERGVSINACKLMVDAMENPKQYEGKRYKVVSFAVIDRDGHEHSELKVNNCGTFEDVKGEFLRLYVSDITELEEIAQTVSFEEAFTQWNRIKLECWDEYVTVEEATRILAQKSAGTIHEMVKGKWHIEPAK